MSLNCVHMVEYPQYKRSGNSEVGVMRFGLGVGKDSWWKCYFPWSQEMDRILASDDVSLQGMEDAIQLKVEACSEHFVD